VRPGPSGRQQTIGAVGQDALIEDRSRPSSMAVASRCTTAPTSAGTGRSGRRVSRLTSAKVPLVLVS
jgi:hypothetical protein